MDLTRKQATEHICRLSSEVSPEVSVDVPEWRVPFPCYQEHATAGGSEMIVSSGILQPVIFKLHAAPRLTIA